MKVWVRKAKIAVMKIGLRLIIGAFSTLALKNLQMKGGVKATVPNQLGYDMVIQPCQMRE